MTADQRRILNTMTRQYARRASQGGSLLMGARADALRAALAALPTAPVCATVVPSRSMAKRLTAQGQPAIAAQDVASRPMPEIRVGDAVCIPQWIYVRTDDDAEQTTWTDALKLIRDGEIIWTRESS